MKKLSIRKILVPTDLSLGAEKAAVLASRIAVRYHASVHLIHIIDDDIELVSGTQKEKTDIENLRLQVAELSDKLEKSENITCGYSIAYGGVVNRILTYIMEEGPELVVMGKGGLEGKYAGTHAIQLTARSPVSVAVVPTESNIITLNRILFPVRPLMSALKKYQLIRPLLSTVKPELTLLSMRNPDCEEELHTVTRLVRMLERQISDDGISYDLEYYFNDSNFAEHILYFLKNKYYDLAVISAERRPGQHFMLSSYVQTILHGCTIPILILFAEHEEADEKQTYFSNRLEKIPGGLQ